MYVIDLNTGQVSERKFPDFPGALTRNTCVAGKDGNYYIGHYATPGIYRFNPANAAMTFLPFDKLAHMRILPYQIGIAGDGKIYMGTASASARIIEFDPATDAFRDMGIPGPNMPAPRYVYSMAVADDFIYSAAGKNPWYLVATNRVTGEHTVLLEDPDYVDVIGSGPNTATRVTTIAPDGSKQQVTHRLIAGKLAAYEPPAPLTPEQRAEAVLAKQRLKESRPVLSLDSARPDSLGNAKASWKLPGEQQWRSAALTGIQTTGWSIEHINTMRDGRIIGVPSGYEDVFTFDPAGGMVDVLGKAPLSAYTTVPVDGRVFILGYPGSYVVDYDLSKPWTYATGTPGNEEPPLADARSNPRECFRFGALLQTHHIIGAALGADGMIYFGAHAERLHVGGGLGWWDPANRKPEGLREPFLVQDCAGLTAAQDGKVIVYSSKVVTDPRGKTPAPDGAMLFVFDTQTKTITRTITPQPGLQSCGPVIAVGDELHGFATAKDKTRIHYQINLASDSPAKVQPFNGGIRSNLKLAPDGQVYFLSGDALMRLHPVKGTIAPVGTMEGGGSITFVGDDLYIAQDSKLLRVRGMARQ